MPDTHFPDTKECNCCQRSLALTEFYVNKRYKYHRTSFCRECLREQHRVRLATPEGREKNRETQARYRTTHLDAYRAYQRHYHRAYRALKKAQERIEQSSLDDLGNSLERLHAS